MPSYVVRNQNFRDNALQVPYPFDAFFEGEVNNFFIDNDVFIDAHFYFKTPVTLPISLTEVNGNAGAEDAVSLTFSDEDSNDVAFCEIVAGDTQVRVFNSEGIDVGVLVLDPIGSSRFVASAQGRTELLTPGDASLHIDTCKVSSQPSLRYIKIGNQSTYGDVVNVVARNGVQWSIDGDVLSLDILGALPPETAGAGSPILSINGVTNPYIWLNTTPESNLRINTESSKLNFNQAKDVTR
jgi:hypothetical protein